MKPIPYHVNTGYFPAKPATSARALWLLKAKVPGSVKKIRPKTDHEVMRLHIWNWVNNYPASSVADCASALDVSEQTVARLLLQLIDLNAMERERLPHPTPGAPYRRMYFYSTLGARSPDYQRVPGAMSGEIVRASRTPLWGDGKTIYHTGMGDIGPRQILLVPARVPRRTSHGAGA